MNEEQTILLMNQAKGTPLEVLIHLALKTGMRQGELFALKWEDFLWETQQIHIQRNLQRVLWDGKQVRNFSTPKTATSDRKFMVGEKTLEALRAQQREVQQKKALVKNRWQENDLVFPSSTGTPLNQSNVLRQYAEI